MSTIDIPSTQPDSSDMSTAFSYDDTVMTSGKYKGLKYEEILETDFNYCYWYYTSLKKEYPFNKYLETKKDLLIEGNQRVNFGKYKGKTFKSIVFYYDEAYVNWIKNIAVVDAEKGKNSNLARLRSYLRSIPSPLSVVN